VVLQPWLCGSVNHTANRNKHHDEEAQPHFCCSTLLLYSMHRPGYVQGGQEASIGCLLLGVYYRRIPGDTGSFLSDTFFKSFLSQILQQLNF
jgi:hypothetical protein